MPKPPVIFLAFANDHQNYLYKLTEEQNAIRNALRQMKKKGLCEVVYETDTDLDKIWRTFNEYQDRIAIFHYGGHAEDYSLLLQRADGQQQLVDGEGLVSFLSRQRGLQLVFINGCSSKRQAEELRDQGIPAVIGTSEPIDDEAATKLSSAFYESLAAGRSIQQAWMNACDMLRSDQIKKQEGYYRAIGPKGGAKREQTLDFPWELHVRPGSENVKDWNLPAAARNPLFGLDLPGEAYLQLPESPFVGLHYFREDDAAIFFGRGAQIRELYNHLQGIHPIILLYGKSGVGKSSMLDAGLLPRIKDKYQTVSARRIQKEGLLGTLDIALQKWAVDDTPPEETVPPVQKDQQKELLAFLQLALEKVQNQQLRQRIEALVQEIREPKSEPLIPFVQLNGVLEKWRRAEAASGKPLLVILDQVEEKFTRPMPEGSHQQEDELLTFLLSIQPLFGNINSGIKGKLILSYRKEYHPEIRDTFQSLSLPYAELFLKRLDREGIIEAIEGVNQHKYTRERYQLQIQAELPVIIADDLLEDQESPIAPVLQIILAKLWSTANQSNLANDQTQTITQFTIADYQKLKSQGTTMSEFFQQQMEQLEQMTDLAEMVDSGLALDLLAAHTTSLGTAGSRNRKQLQERYAIADARIDSLLLALENLSLLSRINAQSTILAHDTLAPVVIRAYNLSDAPGQRAVRILKNKISEVRFQLDPTYLEDLKKAKVPGAEAPELKVGHKGSDKYMSALQASLGIKRWQRDKKEILHQHTRFDFGTGSKPIYLDEADLSIVEGGTGEKESGKAGMRRLFPEEEQLIGFSQARRLKRQRQRKRWIGIGLLGVATIVGLMIFALIQMKIAKEQANKSDTLRLASLVKSLVSEHRYTDALQLAPIAFKNTEPKPVETYEAFSSLLQAGINDTIPIVVAEFDYLGGYHNDIYIPPTFSPDGQRILFRSGNNTAQLWDINTQIVISFDKHADDLLGMEFSPDGRHILTYARDNKAKLWDLQGKVLADLNQHPDKLTKADFSPDGQYIRTTYKKHKSKLWNLKGEPASEFTELLAEEYVRIHFSSDGQSIATYYENKTAKIWDIQGHQNTELIDVSAPEDSIYFSPDGYHILQIRKESLNNRLLDASGNLVAIIPGNSPQFSPNGQLILTVPQSTDKLAVWDVNGRKRVQFEEDHSIDPRFQPQFSPDGQFILTISVLDNTLGLWDLGQGKRIQFAEDYRIDPSFQPQFSPDGQHILSRYADGMVMLWDINGQPKAYLRSPTNSGSADAAFAPDGQHMMTYTESSIQLWKLIKTPIAKLSGRYQDMSESGQQILTSHNKIANLFSLDGQLQAVLRGDDSYQRNSSSPLVAFSANGQYILTYPGNRTMRLWNRKGQPLNTISMRSPKYGTENKVAFTKDGQHILTYTGHDTSIVWDLNGQQVAQLEGRFHESSADGRHILTDLKQDASVKLWSYNGKLKAHLSGQSVEVNLATFSPNGQHILTYAADSTAILWDTTGLPLDSFWHTDFALPDLRSAFFTSDSKHVMAESMDQEMTLWDLHGNPIQVFQDFPPFSGNIKFCSDGQHFLSIGPREVTLWNFNGQRKKRFKVTSEGQEPSAAFSPDGKYFIVSIDGQAGLWSINLQLLAQYKDVAWVKFSPDGKYIITYDQKETKLWPTPPLYESWVDRMKLAPLSEEKQLKYGLDDTE